MPHLIIEYSANLDRTLDIELLMKRLADKAVETGVFPLGGIRVRAHRTEEFVVADGKAENAFVHVWARVGAGRDIETRKAAGQALFDVLSKHLARIFDERPLSIGLEMQELHAELNFRKNNIHAKLAAEAKA